MYIMICFRCTIFYKIRRNQCVFYIRTCITEGITERITEGFTEGFTEGITEGITEGFTEGNIEGITEGFMLSYTYTKGLWGS